MPQFHFLLVGNAPYTNRGCEAIVRGTLAILRSEFGPAIRVTVASFGDPSSIRQQAVEECDPAITHVALGVPGTHKWSLAWFKRQGLKLLHPLSDTSYRPLHVRHRALDEPLSTATAALEIGGDNYSLDYGWPEPFLALDRHIQDKGCPVVLWGASVGPFDAIPREGQAVMFRHLATLNAILVRESISSDYLTRQGITNLSSVSDPAFAMSPQKPDDRRIGFQLPTDAIGLNFSPLMARYVTGGNREDWIKLCVRIVRGALDSLNHPVLLIPHVTSPKASADDAVLLHEIMLHEGVAGRAVYCLPGTLSAAEIKWVISRCAIFAGSRTHATIAAFSSGVPTLSFAYSTKARGLNRDLFGTEAYCLKATELREPDAVVTRLKALLAAAPPIRQKLKLRLPDVLASAFAAGPILRRVLTAADRSVAP
jgi:colanic acid/amylovoran biosynthesis protein